MALAGRRVRATLGAVLVAASLGGAAVLGSASAGATSPSSVTLYVQAGARGATCTGSTATTACGAVKTAVDVAQSSYAGDAVTIDVGRGTYPTHTIVVGTSGSGLAPASLTIHGTGPATTTIDPEYRGGVFEIESGDHGQRVTINGLTIAQGGAVVGGGVDVARSDTVGFFDDSFVTDGADDGGGMFIIESEVTIADSTFAWDFATTGGGVLEATSYDSFYGDTFSSDGATTVGGGLIVGNSEGFIGDSTFATDSASEGGALFVTTSLAISDFDTFATDTATTAGGGIYYGPSATVVVGSILSNATCARPITYEADNVETGDSCGFAPTGSYPSQNTSTTIHLGSLAANTSTGPMTMAIDQTSSAFEAVSHTICVTFPTDERGDPRPGVPGASNCDAGAYEYQQPVLSTTSCPTGAAGCNTASSAPGRTVSVSMGGVTAKTTGRGTVGVDGYRADPVRPMPNGAGSFFGVSLSPGNAVKSVVVTVCGVKSGAALEWWSGTSWERVTPTTKSGSSCDDVTLSSTSTPSLSTVTRLSRLSRTGAVVFGVPGASNVAGTMHGHAVSTPAVPSGGVAKFAAKAKQALEHDSVMAPALRWPSSGHASKWAHMSDTGARRTSRSPTKRS